MQCRRLIAKEVAYEVDRTIESKCRHGEREAVDIQRATSTKSTPTVELLAVFSSSAPASGIVAKPPRRPAHARIYSSVRAGKADNFVDV